MQHQPKILIIGAGLAGLSLAQGLRQANVPFHIFERDTSSSFRAQGYRIRISSEGAAAVRKLVPEQLWNAFEATCAEVVGGGFQILAMTGEKDEGGGRGPPGRQFPPGKAYNADRAILRNLLLSGLEEYVSFGKRLDRYELSGNDEVVVHFTDGTVERGTFLVGADGVWSVVRRQLLPNMVVLDTEGRAVFGKTPVTDEITKLIAPEIGHGLVVVGQGAGSRMKLFTDGMRFDREQSSHFEQELGLEVPADYIYWVLVFRKDVGSAREEESLLHLSSEESVKMSMDLTADWHDTFRALLKHQIPEAASTLAFLTSSPELGTEWAAKPAETGSRVTLLGDSGHPMPPVGGVGANGAFQDSGDLCEAFMEFRNTTEGHERDRLISAYEEKMLGRAKPAVERSSFGAGNFFGMRPLNELQPARMWQ